ncbi:MAG: cytochrome P450 [Jatrophihabitans sp.]|uniref:cytochrome P450 n=1 Tax=Jatrophihabitans sp. TaxID=1932789 RepID=UPI0039143A2F
MDKLSPHVPGGNVSVEARDPQFLPLPPDVPMSWRSRVRAVQRYHTGIEQIRDAGGPVTTVRLGPRRLVPSFVIVASPTGARDVLGGTNDGMDKEMIVHVQSRAFGTNVFNMPHETWKSRRRTLQPLFTKKHVATFAGHMATAADGLATRWVNGSTVDLDAEVRELTLRVIGRSVFGVDLGERHEIGENARTVLQYVTNRSLRPVRAPLWLPNPTRRRFRRALAAIHAVIDDAIGQFRADPESAAELIRLLAEATDAATGRPLTDAAIRDELLVFLIAGHDTTSTTLAYALWALGRNAEMQERVAAEVQELGERPLSVDDVAALPYTTQVLHEALRLCPPAPAIGRMAMKDVVVDGYRVPAGTNLVVGIYALHRDPELWDDPYRFDPDRFAAERSHGRDRWQFLPFGGGPRSCIGDHFAMLEAVLGLASVVRSAEIVSLDEDFPLALPFTMVAGGPIRARVRARVPSRSVHSLSDR